MTKNEIIELNITSLTSDGDGVGRAGETVFFVPNTAVGDTVLVRVLKVKKNIAYGRVESVVTPSPDRIEPDCPVSRSCGGCVYRHISYEAELIKELSALSGDLFKKKNSLEKEMEKRDDFEDLLEKAGFFRDVIFAGMNDIRQTVDKMEDMTRSSAWPYPTYGAILFSVK